MTQLTHTTFSYLHVYASVRVTRVVESENHAYPVDSMVLLASGWRTHTIVNPETVQKITGTPYVDRPIDLGDLPQSLALGAVGMPG